MLAVTLASVGRLKAGAERDLADRYIDRARLAGRALGLEIGLRELAGSRARRAADRKSEEATALSSLLPKGALSIAFDEAGRSWRSEDLANVLRDALDSGAPGATLVIGGPDGLDPAFRDAATHVVALGAMTWPHQLVRIMVAEQLYRAVTILAGHPYHRA
jgi:23S rRNA (pseudouridine1915-N3)-methyltransferase